MRTLRVGLVLALIAGCSPGEDKASKNSKTTPGTSSTATISTELTGAASSPPPTTL
jgi:hypothetical protein